MDNITGIVYDTGVPPVPVVVDTNVFVSALRSRRGAAHALFERIDAGLFELNISVPLVLEYEDEAKSLLHTLPYTASDIDALLDYICAVARPHTIFYQWRPFLPDPKDDMVLELAVAASCPYIVTYNLQHFRGVETFGILAVTAYEFLRRIGALP